MLLTCQLLMLSLKILKSRIPISWGGGGGGGGVAHLPTFDAESKNPKIQNSHFQGGGGGLLTCQLLMLSPKILKSRIPISRGGVAHLPTFDAESKNPKIQNSHFQGGGGLLTCQLLMLSPKILKSRIPISRGEGGLLTCQLLMPSPKILKSRIPMGGGEGLFTNQVFKCSKSNLHRGRLFHQ